MVFIACITHLISIHSVKVVSHVTALHNFAAISPHRRFAIEEIKMFSTSAMKDVVTMDEGEVRKKKQQLRKGIRASIKQLSNNEVENQSLEIWERLFDLPQYKQARSVGLFVSMPFGEIKTESALRRVIRDKKMLYVPRVGLDFELCDMELACVNDFEIDDEDFFKLWPRNKWGIPEPPLKCRTIAKRGDIDVLVVPGVAFDRFGNRLGQGKGYYDRFIASMRLNDETDLLKPFLVAVALAPQYLGDEKIGQSYLSVPVLDHDFKVDLVITPKRIVVCKEVEEELNMLKK